MNKCLYCGEFIDFTSRYDPYWHFRKHVEEGICTDTGASRYLGGLYKTYPPTELGKQRLRENINKKEKTPMGYYTSFELERENLDISEGKSIPYDVDEEIEKFLEDNSDEFYGLRSDDTCKWYDHNEAMLRLSSEFPEVLFILSGEGEENGDVWKKYYANGTVEVDKAELVFKGMSKTFRSQALKTLKREKVTLSLTKAEIRKLKNAGYAV